MVREPARAEAVSAPSTPEKEQSTAAEPVNVLLEELPAQARSLRRGAYVFVRWRRPTPNVGSMWM